MTTTYTFDVFATLDGYGSYGPEGDWGGYWGKQGPELIARRRCCMTTSSEWCSAPTPSASSWRCSGRTPNRSVRTTRSCGCGRCQRRWCRRRSKAR